MARRPKADKPGTPEDDKPVKLTLTLPAKLARRFGVHAEMDGVSKSDLFAELVKTGCRRYVVHDHGKDASGPTETEAA